MKNGDMLAALVDAAEQAPATPRTQRAVRLARKKLLAAPAFTKPDDYALALSNTARALNCIGDGLAWAQKMRASGEPTFKVLPVLLEQNRRAKALLES